MTDTRLKRRIIGMLDKRLHEARLDELEDPRDRRGRRWKLSALLSTAILGLVAGCKGLLEVESLTEDLSLATRKRFAIALPGSGYDAAQPAEHAQPWPDRTAFAPGGTRGAPQKGLGPRGTALRCPESGWQEYESTSL